MEWVGGSAKVQRFGNAWAEGFIRHAGGNGQQARGNSQQEAERRLQVKQEAGGRQQAIGGVVLRHTSRNGKGSSSRKAA